MPSRTHRRQHLEGGAELIASIGPAVLAAQPFPVQQICAGELNAESGVTEAVDRLPVAALGRGTLAEQRTAACLLPPALRGSQSARAGTPGRPDPFSGQPEGARRLDPL
jgi:TRAP-type C4-dicarboxylate transport system permease large subunit